MEIALHSACTLYANLATDIKVANQAGYQAIELSIPKVLRFLDAGHELPELLGLLDGLKVSMLDVLLPIETQDAHKRSELVRRCERVAPIAQQLNCPAIQVVALDDFHTQDWPAQLQQLSSPLQELADIAQNYGVFLALEPVTFSRFHAIDKAVELIAHLGPKKLRLIADTWHLWTSNQSWQQIAELPGEWLSSAHLSDCGPMRGHFWADTDRNVLPGEGLVPLPEAVQAIKETGFTGTWAVELISDFHREWDPEILAKELYRRAVNLIGCSDTSVSPVGSSGLER